jgi:hypothetical protein
MNVAADMLAMGAFKAGPNFGDLFDMESRDWLYVFIAAVLAIFGGWVATSMPPVF